MSLIDVSYLRLIRLVDQVKRKACEPSKPFRRIMKRKGLIIAVLGVDGTGKSTQTKRVVSELKKN